MRLGLLAMSGVRVIDPELAWLGVTLPQFVARGHVVASLPSLSLLTLAALTPEDVDVEYVEIPHIADLNTRRLPDFDAVAISSYSAQIGEAYALADQLRARGTKVILGGPHVTALPQEALQHADAVVLGEAEPLWPRVIEDLGRGRLERIYRAPPARSTTCGNRPSRGSACWTRRTTTASRSRRRAAVRTAASSVPGRGCSGPATARRRSTRCSARFGPSARFGTGRSWSSPTTICSSIAAGAASCSSGSARWGSAGSPRRTSPLPTTRTWCKPCARPAATSFSSGWRASRATTSRRSSPPAGRPAAWTATSTPSARSRTPG